MRMLETKYAIIEIGAKQFMVTEGDSFKIFTNSDIKTFSTLLLKDGDTLEIGAPALEKGGVSLTHTHDKKIKTEVRRFKGKSRYRVNKSHSDDYSYYAVKSIKVGDTNSINESEKPVVVAKSEKPAKIVKKVVTKKPKVSVKKVVKKTTKVKKEGK